jgi:RHS repeat-associated protein
MTGFIVYDGDGNRVSETVGGVTTNYLVDTVNPTGYAQVVDELQNGTVSRTYSYGLERIDEDQNLNGTWTASFYGYDGHGSVRQLTNLSGTVTDTYDYDAFGNLINSTGSTSNNYLFAGEQYDPALGLYYNRARYYNYATGRFWSMDTVAGSDSEPKSLHRYLYASGNPVDRVDPDGQEDADVMTNLSTAAAVVVLAVATVVTLAYVCYAYAELSGGGGPCGNHEGPKIELYHYTALPNLDEIKASGVLKPSLTSGGDAYYGEGQYLTDISPSDASKRTKGQLAYALYSLPFKWRNSAVGYLEFSLYKDNLKLAGPVYGPSFPGKSIYLNPSLLPLPLNGTLTGSGVVNFLPGP